MTTYRMLSVADFKTKKMFKRRKWSTYEHVMFVEDFRAGVKTYDLLRKECELTGDIRYKRVYVKSCVHGLSSALQEWWKQYSC